MPRISNADALVEYDGLQYFTEPHVEIMTMSVLLAHLRNSGKLTPSAIESKVSNS